MNVHLEAKTQPFSFQMLMISRLLNLSRKEKTMIFRNQVYNLVLYGRILGTTTYYYNTKEINLTAVKTTFFF